MTSEEKAAAVDSFASPDYTWIALTCPEAKDDCQKNFDLWFWEYSNKRLTDTVGWGTRFTKNGEVINGGGSNENCAHLWSPGVWGPQTCTSTFYGTLCEKRTSHCKY